MEIAEIKWAEHLHCAITVCDTEGVIIYMNEKARETFASHGNLIGQNLFGCHKPESQAKIREMIETDTTNAYTIDKQGVKKVIYQTPWKKDGRVAGMVEISMVVAENMPHFKR